MDALVLLVPLLPVLAAAAIGLGGVLGVLGGDKGRLVTADLAVWSTTLSFLMVLALLVGDLFGKNQGQFSIGQWLTCDTLDIHVSFSTSGFQVAQTTVFALLLAVLGHNATGLLPDNAGYHRFFFRYSLFCSAFLALLLFSSTVGTFIAWVATGWCAYGLLNHADQRPSATAHALRLLLVNRMGDAGFIAGISLGWVWLGQVNWPVLQAMATELSVGQATGIGLCFALAAAVKSAQLPFTAWSARALDGPAPTAAMVYGAVMGHAGVFLLCLLQPVFAQSLFASALLVLTGLATAVYSHLVRLSQADPKTALVYASSGQIGLMFLACGLGFWSLIKWYLCAHAIVRCWQFLSLSEGSRACSADVDDSRQVPNWLFVAALQRFWLEQFTDWTLLKPVRSLARDLSYFDIQLLDRLLGMPTLSLDHWQPLAYRESHLQPPLAKDAGLLGHMTVWTAARFLWLENRLLWQGLGRSSHRGRGFGRLANKLERIILRPRYLALFIGLTFLMAF